MARWFDLLQTNKIDTVSSCISAYKYYLEVFHQTLNPSYAFRAFSIVRFKKDIFKSYTLEIANECELLIKSLKSAHQYEYLIFIIGGVISKQHLRDKYRDNIQDRIKSSLADKNYNDALCYINALETISALNSKEAKKRRSNIIEEQADFFVENKEENTFYPHVASLYKKALREIFSLDGCDIEKKRLSEKLAKEQEELSKLISICGVPMIPQVDYRKICREVVDKYHVNDESSAWKFIVNFPIVTNATVEDHIKFEKKNEGVFLKYFPDSSHLNEKGATVNHKRGDASIEDRTRTCLQNITIAYI